MTDRSVATFAAEVTSFSDVADGTGGATPSVDAIAAEVASLRRAGKLSL